uniref:Uncharacterized protein n=1 Tax=Amphimedon queenslandica TaxID=400682 RepID=A0A1X7VW83_AMPQE
MQMRINGPQEDNSQDLSTKKSLVCRKSDPAPSSDVMITSSDQCHSESDTEQLDYDYEESADGDDLGVHPCTCPNYPRRKMVLS